MVTAVPEGHSSKVSFRVPLIESCPLRLRYFADVPKVTNKVTRKREKKRFITVEF